MDGHFVPNITIGAPVVKALRKVSDLILDVHLMIENPAKYIDDFANAGADYITFHYEAARENTNSVIKQIKEKGIKVGLSIKPKTQVEAIKEYINNVDMILIMTVEPGFGGQSFMKDCAEKIKEIKKFSTNEKLRIEVDGGINEETANICKEYGADTLVAGSYIYGNKDIEYAINSLR
jgi:ribulose-phosphate 3-epimerase